MSFAPGWRGTDVIARENEIKKQITMSNERPFEFSEIEDVRIIVKAKGKHYAVVSKGDKEESLMARLAAFATVIESHFVVCVPLEEIDTEARERNGGKL